MGDKDYTIWSLMIYSRVFHLFILIYLSCSFVCFCLFCLFKLDAWKGSKPSSQSCKQKFQKAVFFLWWFSCQEKRRAFIYFFCSHLIICFIYIPFRYEHANTKLNRWFVFLFITSWRGKSNLSFMWTLLMEQQCATPKWCQPHDPMAIHTDLGRGKVTVILNLIQL